MFAPGISVVALIRGDMSPNKLIDFLVSVKKQNYNNNYINISVVCVHNNERNIFFLADVCKDFSSLFILITRPKESLQGDFVRAFALNFAPTRQVLYSDLRNKLSFDDLNNLDRLSGIDGIYIYDQIKQAILDNRLTRVTAVIPTSSVSFVPPLTNCLASINAQIFDKKATNIIVTYVHNNSKEDLKSLVDLCVKHNAAIMFHNHNYPCFPPALARNVGARRVINAITAFVDVDTVMHPHTFSRAVELMKDGNTVVHVAPAMMHHVNYNSECFKNLDPNVYEENMLKGRLTPGTSACIFVPSRVLKMTHGYDERFIGHGAEDWDFTDRLKPLNVKFVSLSKQEGNIRAMHQPHEPRISTSPRSRRNKLLYAKLKGKQPQRNPHSWGGIPVR